MSEHDHSHEHGHSHGHGQEHGNNAVAEKAQVGTKPRGTGTSCQFQASSGVRSYASILASKLMCSVSADTCRPLAAAVLFAFFCEFAREVTKLWYELFKAAMCQGVVFRSEMLSLQLPNQAAGNIKHVSEASLRPVNCPRMPTYQARVILRKET